MCELFGYFSRTPADLRPWLGEFFRHSEVHCHGWGIARVDTPDVKVIKAGEMACASSRLPGLVETMGAERAVLAHIRYATVGEVSDENCQPFHGKDNTGRPWTMVHNGTIFRERALLPYVKKQQGSTDSERFFLCLMDRVNTAIEEAGGELCDYERFQVVESLVRELAEMNKLNLIICDGSQVYVHTNMPGTLHYRREEESLLVATAPLDEGEWEQVPLQQVLAFQEGSPVFVGRKHPYEFVEAMQSLDETVNFVI